MKNTYLFRICGLVIGLSLGSGQLAVGDIQLHNPGRTDELLTLGEVFRQTQENNPELHALHLKYEAARHRIPQVSALPDPKLQLMHFVESVQTRTGPQRNVFTLSQGIPWFGTLKNREAVASAEAEALWFGYQAKHLQVMREVALAFYEYAYLFRAVELSSENLELLERLEPIVEERVRSGGDLTALLRLKVETGRIANRRNSFQEQIVSNQSKLLALMGVSPAATLSYPQWERPGRVDWDTKDLLESLERFNPELAALERQEKSALARIELAKLGSYPDFTLGVNYIDLGESENPLIRNSGRDPWGVMVSVNVPIFRDKYRSARSEALANSRAIESVIEDRRNKLVSDLFSASSRHRDAQRRLDLYGNELLPLAEQALEISRTGYENGRTGILEVIDSERTLRELQLENWRAAADVWKSRFIIRSMTDVSLVEPFTEKQ